MVRKELCPEDAVKNENAINPASEYVPPKVFPTSQESRIENVEYPVLFTYVNPVDEKDILQNPAPEPEQAMPEPILI
jgi:hypothetical protein